MLWSTEDPVILSGTVLPVYIRSNIDHVWVVGVPETSRKEKNKTKIEVPIKQFEFTGSKRKARKWAEGFSKYASTYAENLQDGLPIRDAPDNGSRRVYRLRTGEIIKILDLVEGNPPIGATGDPLPGDWYNVLTHEGATGFCFSYRLKLFDHFSGPLLTAPASLRETAPDPDLDLVMSRKWSPESYLQMINSRQLDIAELEKHWHFDPGQDTGIARIMLPDMKREFVYQGIYPDGERAWLFDGTTLQMDMRTPTTLAVQFTESAGTKRTFIFSSLSTDVEDLIMQENIRREGQFRLIYDQGPVFTSNNYGTIAFSETGGFSWTGFELLTPNLIPASAKGDGQARMDLFLTPSFEERYNGAATFIFSDVTPNAELRFMYILDSQGMSLEVIPDYAVEGVTVTRRASSPMVMYFFRDYSY